MYWHCNKCDSNFDSVRYDIQNREKCPHCGDCNIVKLKWRNDKQEKENGMKKVYEFVIYSQEEILWEGKVLARDEDQARLLIPSKIDPDVVIDFSAESVEVRIRPFC